MLVLQFYCAVNNFRAAIDYCATGENVCTSPTTCSSSSGSSASSYSCICPSGYTQTGSAANMNFVAVCATAPSIATTLLPLWIVLGVVGGVAVLALLGGLAFVVYRCRNLKKKKSYDLNMNQIRVLDEPVVPFGPINRTPNGPFAVAGPGLTALDLDIPNPNLNYYRVNDQRV